MGNWQELKKQIIAYSRTIGIDKIGFTGGEPFTEIKEILLEHRKKGFSSGFEEQDINFRIDPSLILPDVRSIISLAVAYPSREPQCSSNTTKARGKFCRASWGQDYHIVLKEKLAKLEQFIKSLVPGAKTLSMVDTGPLSDRSVAARAGLGWLGKNGSLITEEYGSFVYLGELLTNLPLEPDQPVSNKCGSCTKCLEACPMQAIIQEKFTINAQKCLAYQTLTKGHLTNELKEKIAQQKYLYGCDVCQLVCPFNQAKTNDWHAEFQPDYELINPVLEDFCRLSNKDFKKIYGHMSGSWRGKKNLQRNAVLVMGKYRDEENIPLLAELLKNDQRPEIRAAAAWSLGKYGLKPTEDILREQMEKEKDERVLREIKDALNESGVILDKLK